MKNKLYDDYVYKINLLYEKYEFLFYNILVPCTGTVLEQTDEKIITLLSFMFPSNDYGKTETVARIEIKKTYFATTEMIGVDKIEDIKIKKIFHLMDSLFDLVNTYNKECNDYYKNKKVYIKLYDDYFTIKYVNPKSDEICIYKNNNNFDPSTICLPSFETNIRDL